jgi:hypothetical protein
MNRATDLPCPALSSKIFSFPPDPNHLHVRRRPTPHEGRIAIVTDAGRDAVDAAASGARSDRRAGSHEPVSDQSAQTNGAASGFAKAKARRAGTKPGEASWRRRVADGKAVWFWHPLLVSSWRRCCEPDRVRRALFANDGDKTNSSPGRARNRPLKPLRREGRVFR